MRIGGYNRTKDTSKYEEFRIKETVVHPWFKTKYTRPVTYVSHLCWSAPRTAWFALPLGHCLPISSAQVVSDGLHGSQYHALVPTL